MREDHDKTSLAFRRPGSEVHRHPALASTRQRGRAPPGARVDRGEEGSVKPILCSLLVATLPFCGALHAR